MWLVELVAIVTKDKLTAFGRNASSLVKQKRHSTRSEVVKTIVLVHLV